MAIRYTACPGLPGMTALMVYAGSVADDARVTRTGGTPLAPDGFGWPSCRACEGPMRFIALVMLGDLGSGASQGVMLIFMCGNDPGMCAEWDATSGGNRALIFAAGGRLAPAAVPADPLPCSTRHRHVPHRRNPGHVSTLDRRPDGCDISSRA
jgi:hypothetical protein